MKGFDERFIDELKNKCNIVDIASRYLHLEQKGGNFWGRCPFHHEKTASFCINSMKQFYYCFGCHKSGDVISFVQEIESVDFADAVKILAEKVGMKLPEVRYDDEKVKEQKEKKERILSLLKDTALFYVANLKREEAGKHVEYIIKRGIKGLTVSRFGIGASLDFESLPKYLREKGYSESDMIDSGAVEKSKTGRLYDSLGGRLIIPIINPFGQVVAFGGRLLEKADFAKYKNTKETVVFSKSRTLYNLVNVKKLKNERGLDGIIIVEGYMDTISLAQAGFENVVASMGTALTKDQSRILKRYTDKVYICYDGDSAGQNATIRGLELLADEGLEVKVVSMPEELDPDEVIAKYGKDGYAKLLVSAKPLIDFKLDVIESTYDLNSVDGRRKYVTNALKIIAESSSSAEQEDLLKVVRDRTGVSFEALKRELYGINEEDKSIKVVLPQASRNTADKTITAGRFVLASYLSEDNFTSEEDLRDIPFHNSTHDYVKSYILGKKAENKSPRIDELYQLIDDQEELSSLAEIGTGYSASFDKERYFYDCVKTLKKEYYQQRVNVLTEMAKSETDLNKRKELTNSIMETLTAIKKL